VRPLRTSLWFDGNALEAAEYYVSVFPDSEITDVQHFTEAGPGAPGTVVTVAFHIGAMEFVAINGGPHYQFSPAISFVIECADQTEVDRYWNELAGNGGKPSKCGWLEDRHGLSWQVIPTELYELIQNPAGAEAMLEMEKIDLEVLRRAVARP
jgi:predicted 3-demethylubiquinone-9 3-methyltransferase (glyoxalase superfamily)